MIAAKKAGYAITLHLDSATRTMVDEFSTSNCLLLTYDGDDEDKLKSPTLTVPASPSILKSVTAKSIAEIARALGWKVDITGVPFETVKVGLYLSLCCDCCQADTSAEQEF